MAVSSARIASVASDRTAMIASSAPIARAAISAPSSTRVRVPLEERPIGLGRRVGAVAVRDDDAAAERAIAAARAGGDDIRQGGVRGDPPLLGGREAGAAAAAEPGRGDRRDRPVGAEVADRPLRGR